jgi:ribosomal protein S18 acetylase RimI-like enzyme
MPSTLHVSQMTTQDVPVCAHIIGLIPLFEQYGLTPQAANEFLDNALQTEGNDLLVATQQSDENNIVIGFAWFVPKGSFARSGYLRLIAIHPDAHRSGAGKALMDELERRYLAPAGITLLTTHTNTNAHQFYERLGYQQIGEIPNYVKTGLHERIYFKPANN